VNRFSVRIGMLYKSVLSAVFTAMFCCTAGGAQSPGSGNYDYAPGTGGVQRPVSSGPMPDRVPVGRGGVKYSTPGKTTAFGTAKLTPEQKRQQLVNDATDKNGLWVPELVQWERTAKGSEARRQASLVFCMKAAKAGSWKDMLFYASNLVLDNPNQPKYLLMRAKALEKMERYDDCFRTCWQVVEIDPTSPELQKMMNNCSARLARVQPARQ
jgi:hypothetical protein